MLFEHFCLELCHNHQQEVVSTQLWISILFNSLRLVGNDWGWLLLLQLMYKAVNRDCIIFVPMFQGIVKFVNEILCILSCNESCSGCFCLKVLALVTFNQCSPYTYYKVQIKQDCYMYEQDTCGLLYIPSRMASTWIPWAYFSFTSCLIASGNLKCLDSPIPGVWLVWVGINWTVTLPLLFFQWPSSSKYSSHPVFESHCASLFGEFSWVGSSLLSFPHNRWCIHA